MTSAPSGRDDPARTAPAMAPADDIKAELAALLQPLREAARRIGFDDDPTAFAATLERLARDD